MFLSKLFKHTRAKVMTTLAGLTMVLGVGAAIVTTTQNQNEVVETKAEADTVYYTDQIIIHVIDDKWPCQTSDGHDFWMHCWNITVDTEYSIFGDISDANEASALWSKLNYNSTNKTFDVAGNYEWFQNGDYGRRSYKFDFPWFVTGFQFEVSLNGTGCNTKPTVSSRQYTRWYFKESWSFEEDGKETKPAKYNAPAYTMSFNTNGGSSQSSFVFREWQKTSQPGSNPTKDMQKFVKWTETNDSSASAFAFGSNLTAPITLYAQWTYHLLMWKPTGAKTTAYCWYEEGSGKYNDGDWPGKPGATIEIDGTAYYYVTVGIDATFCIFNNGSNAQQTSDLPIRSGALEGQYYYDESSGSWEEPQVDILYKDQGDKTYSGTTGSSRPSKHNWALSTTIPTDMGKPGYTFGGWYDNASCTGTAITSIGAYSSTSDITLYAKWTANGFTISYNANTGSGTTDSTSLTYDAAGSLRTNSFTAPNAGNIFKEWNTQADGKGTSYSSGASLSVELVNDLYSMTPEGSKTLYAIWESGENAAITFATDFNTSIGGVCKNDNTTNTTILASRWASQKTTYTPLAAHVKYWLAKTTHSSDTNVTNMLAKYDYVCGKYGTKGKNLLGESPDFLSRDPDVPSSPAGVIPGAPRQDQSPLTLTLWIVLGTGVLGLGAIGTAYFVSKKKERHQA